MVKSKRSISRRNPMARSLWDGSCSQRVVPGRKKKPKRAKDKLRRELRGEADGNVYGSKI